MAMASAGTTVHVEAQVDLENGAVSGQISIDSTEPFVLVDPLANLPIPEDDRISLRTFPGAAERGQVTFEAIAPGEWWFMAILPRRYGDIGALPAHGLFANSSWYPQPLVDGKPPSIEWTATVQVPAGSAGALGSSVGTDTLEWSGSGDRLSLAVVPKGQITPLLGKASLVTKGKPRKTLIRELQRALGPGSVDPLPLAVVETPDRRRLGRSGLGLAYVSDRAFRNTPGLRSFHRKPIARTLQQASFPQPDPYARALAAAAITYTDPTTGADTLKKFSWTPFIHSLLYSENLPFFSEIFDRTYPTDPVNDDLADRYDPTVPASAVVHQIADAYGSDALSRLSFALAAGKSVDEAAKISGIPKQFFEQWRRPAWSEDFQIIETSEGTRIVRQAPIDAPPETVYLLVDKKRVPWRVPQGPAMWVPPPDFQGKLVIDPDVHLKQPRLGDSHPPRWLPTGWAFIESIDFKNAIVEAEVTGTLRRSDDTHHLGYASVYASRETRIGVEFGYIWRFGPRLDGLRHTHRIGFGFGPSYLDDRFVPIPSDARLALEAGISYTYDSRIDAFFPLKGARLSLAGEAGGVPTADEHWTIGKFSALVLTSPHPRFVLAAQFTGGLADSTLEHQLLPLGGDEGLWSLSSHPALGEARAVTRMDWRWAPLRHASVPMFLLWGSELQLTAGLEAGAVWRDGQPTSALGATAGFAVGVEWFGMSPALSGITIGVPLTGVGIPTDHKPSWFFRVGQSF